jgi:hypothetical protein
MRRLFWVTVGAAGAVVVARRLEQAARRYTPAGVAERVEVAGERTTEAVGGALQRFRAARAERELELLTTLLVAPEGGDPHAVFGRGRQDRDPWPAETSSSAGRTGASARPSGRVDESEPLYDF